MGFGDLFKSKSERQKETQKKRRKAFREAESAVDDVKGRIEKMKRDRDKAWKDARQYLKDGQKAASQRCLQTVRASELLMTKLEQKRWVFEQLLSKLEMAQTDQEFSKSLSAINAVVEIDPEAVADVLDEVQDKLGEQVDTDKIWEKVHEKEMEGVENKLSDVVPSIEEMAAQLEDEVAEDINEDKPSRSKGKGEKSETRDKIGEGRKRLKDLLEGDK